jgi:protein SCO1/2
MSCFKPWRFQAISASGRARTAQSYLLIFLTVASLAVFGCNRTNTERGMYPVEYQTDGLPNLTLTDQYGHPLALAALKGQPALFDFIYTSCPGPCQLLTQHMKLIANQLGPALGSKISFVSVTVDPEHDRPNRLFDYARAFEANVKGWYFLTGSSAQIDQLMSSFRLERKREGDGEIGHVLGYFLVAPDGHPIVEYSEGVEPSIAARDAEEAASKQSVIAWVSTEFRKWI